MKMPVRIPQAISKYIIGGVIEFSMVTSRWNRSAVPPAAPGGQARGTSLERSIAPEIEKSTVTGITAPCGRSGIARPERALGRQNFGCVDKETGAGHNDFASLFPVVPKWRNWQTR